MDRSWSKRAGYNLLRTFCRLWGVAFWNFRCFGRDRIPEQGAVLVCSNHQSFADPVIVGASFDRRLNYLARKSLFRLVPFRWLIEFLDAIPLDREGLSMSGLKECLRRLKQGEAVLIFPEGTRTWDGKVAPLQSGFTMLARRSNVVVLPVGIDGAFHAWPRWLRLPRLGSIHVCIGEPISSSYIAQLDDAALAAEVYRRIVDCQTRANHGLRSRA